MRVSLIVGISATSHDLRSLLEINARELQQRGWAVAEEAHSPLSLDGNSQEQRHAAEQTIATWSKWLPGCQADAALLSCVHLADALLVSGEAKAIVTDARSYGEVRCGALVQRFDDYIATRYVSDLLIGRARRLTDRELAGRGDHNYPARLTKWQEAAGSDFTAVMSHRGRPEQEAIIRLLDQLGLAGAATLTFPEPSAARTLDAVGAEVLRTINSSLQMTELDEAKAQRIRAEAVASLTSSAVGPPFAIPAASAKALLETFEEQSAELAKAMSPADREQYLSQKVVADVPLDEALVSDRVKQLSEELGIEVDQGQRPAADESIRRIRQLSRRAKSARRDGDMAKYDRVTQKLGRAISELPEYQSDGRRSGAAGIPHRVVQYWDPLPPPEEMVPWIDSWATVGFPGADHTLASFETGLSVVQDVAGELGRRAFESAPHPAVRADLFRYAELFKHGGWYVDAEHEAMLPTLDALNCPVDHVLLVRTVYDRILNNFMGAVPGSSIMKAALLRGCENLLDNAGGSVIELTGPIMFTQVFREYQTSTDASYIVIPSNAVLTGVLQKVHNDAEYKIHGHWRYTDLSPDT